MEMDEDVLGEFPCKEVARCSCGYCWSVKAQLFVSGPTQKPTILFSNFYILLTEYVLSMLLLNCRILYMMVLLRLLATSKHIARKLQTTFITNNTPLENYRIQVLRSVKFKHITSQISYRHFVCGILYYQPLV